MRRRRGRLRRQPYATVLQLLDVGRAHGWTSEVRPEDDDGNILITWRRRSRETVSATVFIDHVRRARPRGEVLAARDEHGSLPGAGGLRLRLALDPCPFCPPENP